MVIYFFIIISNDNLIIRWIIFYIVFTKMKFYLEKNGYTLLNKWWRGEIRTKETSNGKIARKIPISMDKKWALIRESFLLEKMQWKLDFVPELVETGDGWFEYKFIEGKTLKEHKVLDKNIYSQLVDISYELDRIWIFHGEINRPTGNVIINAKWKLFLIDYERWKLLKEWNSKNLRMIGQFLASQKLFDIKDFVIFLKQNPLQEDLKDYLIQKI